MGDDFSNRQIYAGDADTTAFRRDFLRYLRSALSIQGFVETSDPESASRVLAIGAAARWICLYDSCGGGDSAHPQQFLQLSKALSHFAPVVEVEMNDSCALHLHLYENGEEIDRFGNAKSAGQRWESEAERLSFRGKSHLWQRFLPNKSDEDLLRQSWNAENATMILVKTAQTIGWHETFCFGGFTVDYDGVAVFYREHFGEESPTTYGELLQDFPPLDFFDEFYFSNSSTQ